MAIAFDEIHWSSDVPIKAYLVPRTQDEALEMLEKHNGAARIVAGGTDVIPLMRSRQIEETVLVDITCLPGMKQIEDKSGKIAIGGLVTHAQVASSGLIREKAPLLAEAAGWVGSPQIRNVATLAGNLVSGQPAADTSIPLLALGASVVILSREGEKTVPLTDFFIDIGKTVLDSRFEILVRIEFNALSENFGSSYLRLGKRKALTLPILVAATIVNTDPTIQYIKKAAVAMGPVAPTPLRLSEVERRLQGAPICTETLEMVAEYGMNECRPRDSILRGSCEYRTEMVKVFIKRGLKKALEAAGAVIG
jgi:carbon-monoxide dehydrogenase medium subunit